MLVLMKHVKHIGKKIKCWDLKNKSLKWMVKSNMYIFLFCKKPISVITIKGLSFSFIYDQRSCHSTPSAVLWVSIAVRCNAWGMQPRVACGAVRGHHVEDLLIPWLLHCCQHSICLLLSLVTTLKLLSDTVLFACKTVNYFPSHIL